MKILALVLLVCSTVHAYQEKQTTQHNPNLLTSEQVLAWLSYYGQPLDKDISQAVSLFGEPDAATTTVRRWNPSAKTGYRAVSAVIRPAAGGGGTALRITVYPHPTDVLSVNDLLHQPERFIFDSGHDARLGSYFSAETRNRQIKIQ